MMAYLPEELSDSLLASLFAAQATTFRKSSAHSWLTYDGCRWTVDTLSRHQEAVQSFLEVMAGNSSSSRFKRTLLSAKTNAAVLKLAGSKPEIAIHSDAFDREHHLLNTPTGTVDLRTGRIEPHNLEDYLMKMTRVGPLDAQPERFLRFMNEVFPGDSAMVAFMQRLLGYCLTGEVREQKFTVCHGVGANGKNTLVDLVMELMGDYAMKLPIATLMQQRFKSHDTEIAQLHGIRLAVSSEPNHGEAWNEGRIKEVTGDKVLRARYMRQDFFEFPITHKHLVTANYQPRFKGSDPAMGRRLVLIPFNAVFDAASRDPKLPETLLAEGPQILSWLIEGARQWYADGLQIPDAVKAATDEYQASQDVLGQWLEERCSHLPNQTCKSKDLYDDFCRFREMRNERKWSHPEWAKEMKARGYEKQKSNGVRYRGLALNPARFYD